MRQSARSTFPCNCLVCSLDRFRFIIRTPLPKPPKQVRLFIRHYLLLRLHCTSLLVSRYMRWRMTMRHLWYRDTYLDTSMYRYQCLIQDQIFTSPSPGAVDPRARACTSAACARAPRAHERRVRMSAARSRSQRHCRLLIAPILLLNNKLAN